MLEKRLFFMKSYLINHVSLKLLRNCYLCDLVSTVFHLFGSVLINPYGCSCSCHFCTKVSIAHFHLFIVLFFSIFRLLSGVPFSCFFSICLLSFNACSFSSSRLFSLLFYFLFVCLFFFKAPNHYFNVRWS